MIAFSTIRALARFLRLSGKTLQEFVWLFAPPYMYLMWYNSQPHKPKSRAPYRARQFLPHQQLERQSFQRGTADPVQRA
jgi:hypothetical protein